MLTMIPESDPVGSLIDAGMALITTVGQQRRPVLISPFVLCGLKVTVKP